ELAPVDLELVARRGLEAHGQLLEASPLGAERTDEVLDERDLTRVAALTQLAKKHGRMDLGLLLDSLRQVVLVRLQNARPLRSRRVVRRLLVAKIAPHGVAADSELFGDAANRSPLAMHGFDVHPGLQCEHPGLRLRGREKGPGSSYIRGRVVASAASRLRPDSPASWGGSVFNRRRRVNFQPAMTTSHSRPPPWRPRTPPATDRLNDYPGRFRSRVEGADAGTVLPPFAGRPRRARCPTSVDQGDMAPMARS